MVHLIKYEFIRKWHSLAIFLGIALGLNAAVLLRIKTGSMAEIEQMLSLTVFFGGMLAAFFLLFIIDVSVMYSQDLQRKSGYMIFLTPNSGYKILGAKILTGILEGLLFLMVYLMLIGINFFGIYGKPLREFLMSEIYASIITHLQLNGLSLVPFITVNLLTAFVSIVTLVLTIFAAISLGRSILVEKKFGGFLTFVILLLLGWFNAQVTRGIMDMIYQTGVEGIRGYGYLVSYMIIQIAFGIIYFTSSGYLLDKKIDV